MLEAPLYRVEVVPPAITPTQRLPWSGPRDLDGLEPVGMTQAGTVFASRALKAEVQAIQESGGLPPGTIYHCTSSNALTRIAEQKALLCSREAMRLYGSVESGEIARHQTSGRRPRVLDDVYARHSISTGYFFGDSNHYPVIFGIHGVDIKQASGDGLKLGPRVSLDEIVSLTVPADQLLETKAWVADHCRPGTLALSQYAASLIPLLGLYRPPVPVTRIPAQGS